MFINHSSKEVTAKIVYYGAGLSGKTTNLQYIFSITNPKSRGELVSVETDIERTLFFDLLPITVGLIKGYFTKFQLYTVPGQVFYNSTRKMVLKGADGIVFVADSQEAMESANLDSYENLEHNLSEDNKDIKELPLVFQYNKQDLKNLSSNEHLNDLFNKKNLPYFNAVSKDGIGVVETLREISTLTLKKIKTEIENIGKSSGSTPIISFDINPKKKIISKEELPLKRISADNKEYESENEISGNIDIDLEEVEAEFEVSDNINKVEKTEDHNSVIETKTIESVEIPALNKVDFKLLNELKNDDSRLTVLKKIKESDFYKIDIQDKNSKLIKSIDINVKSNVKKINLILDVKE